MRGLQRTLAAFVIVTSAFVGPVSAATSVVATNADAASTTNLQVAAVAQASAIVGHVVGENGANVAQASVTIDGAGQHVTVTTDAMGVFTAALPAGIYTVTVNKGGYQTGSTEVTVSTGAKVNVDVTLTEATLNSLTVIGKTSGSAGSNVAKFNISSSPVSSLNQDQIQERDVPDLTQVVNELPGITIPHATSNPNQGFVIRGMRYETTVTLDGHPVSSGTSGQFLTNYATSSMFSGIDVVKGGGLNGPVTGEAGIGLVNLRTADFSDKDLTSIQVTEDSWNGSDYNLLLKRSFLDGKLSLVLGKSFKGYRGPTYQQQVADGSGATIPSLNSFSVPQNLTNAIIPYIGDFSDTYSLNGSLAKIRWKFSNSTSLAAEFLGLEGRFDPQGGAYGQFEGYATISQCLNGTTPGNGAACVLTSKYNTPAAAGLIGQSGVPLYAFYPGSDVRQNQPNFNLDFRTTLGNDTILFRPYTAAINRLIDGSGEAGNPGNGGGWYQVTNSANCQAQYVAPVSGVGAYGPCFAAGVAPVVAYIGSSPTNSVLFPTTPTAPTCTLVNPCYTTPTSQTNGGTYGFGSPYTTLELDKLFGYTFSYIHPVGANTYGLSFDHYYDDATAFVNDASPIAAGCTFTLGSTANTAANAGIGYQPSCPLTNLHPSPLSVPNTFTSRTSVGLTGQFALLSNLQLDLGGYYTRYQINGQKEDPAFAANIAAYAQNSNAFPVQLVGTVNQGSHFDPRMGLTYRPNRDTSVRFSFGSSETLPYASLVSGFVSYGQGITSTTISTPNYGLLPEEIVQQDLGLDYRLADGSVFSGDIYNTVVHNPWLATKIPVCTDTPTCAALYPNLEQTGAIYLSQTLNGAEQHAMGVELAYTNEPKVGFGYRVNAGFERNYYMNTPAVDFGNNFQTFFNGAQYTSTGSGATSVPYAKGYGEIRAVAANGSMARLGIDYEGNNNSYNAPAFFIYDAGVKINTGFHGVMLGVTAENITNQTFGALLGRGDEYQGLPVVTAKPVANGYTYSLNTSAALVSPGPETFRFSLSKQF